MNALASCLIFLLFGFYSSGKEKIYIASTPAASIIKVFLGIPLSDSVDYLRWKIMLGNKEYTLHCNYTVVNNTNDVKKNSREVQLKGILSQEKNVYTLYNKSKTLKLAALNADLLHILNMDNSLLIGNGGWSYTINNFKPSVTADLFIKPGPTVIKDSMVFIGRSPCGIPGIILEGGECYKLKWKIVFYGDSRKNEPTTCKVYATPYRKEGVKSGTWKMITESNGRIRYHIYDESGKPYLYLQKADENILLFTDASGKLLIGDEEYSFTLNRKV